MRKLLVTLSVFCCLTAFSASAATEITVYTASEPELLQPYTKAFNEAYPDITIKWVRDSTGPILARLVAEKDAPRADAIFGLSLSAVLTLEPYDLFAPYTPAEIDQITPAMRDKSASPAWAPMNAWGAALCINKPELEKLGLPMPESWADLTNPVYKGHIVMPTPVSSGTALLAINGWKQGMGEEKAWEYMTALHKNMKMYVHSGCKPCQMTAQGEAVIGIASDTCVRPLLQRKAPIGVVIPKEGVGWDTEIAVLVKNGLPDGAPRREAAKKVLDFAVSKPVGKLAADNAYIPARTDCMDDAAKRQQAKFLPMDFQKVAQERDATIAKWRGLFEQK